MATSIPHRGIPIEAWTQETIHNLSTLHISAATVARPPSAHAAAGPRGTSVTLDIPLDDEHSTRDAPRPNTHAVEDGHAVRSTAYPQRREPLRRDSLKRREALLKGKEGSRRRQRWENDRLLGNPYLTPPEPHDWAPQPTHPVHAVPYILAPLWDERKAQAAYARAERERELRIAGDEQRRVPRELRERLKRSRAARGLLQALEEPVREFVGAWAAARGEGAERAENVGVEEEEGWMDAGAALREDEEENTQAEEEASDDEIVFVGRNGGQGEARAAAAAAGRKRKAAEEERLQRDKLVFDGLVDDLGASFGRWLVHTIAAYYNLRTWSVTTGNPARREAYVGIPDGVESLQLGGGKSLGDGSSMPCQLPRPLWVMV